MTNNYASGKIAKAICDRCGLRYDYRHLRFDGDIPGLRVCHACWDPIDPYKLPPRQPDNYALQYPRPDEPLRIPDSLLTDDGDVLVFNDDGDEEAESI